MGRSLKVWECAALAEARDARIMRTRFPRACMQPRHPRSVSLFLCAALLTASAAAQSSRPAGGWARNVLPRTQESIFSPLDLPTPGRVRTAAGAPGPDYWQQQVDYRIDVALEPETRMVRGHERVTYFNHSPEALDYLWLHLEQNLLRKDSIGNQIGGNEAVGGPIEHGEGVKVLALTAEGKPLEYKVYDTMARVELPRPLAASGGRVEFEVAWEFRVPDKVFRRYGTLKSRKGIVWEIAQWFPAVAVFDDVHGWNTLPYIGTGEFYTNFGTFDVSVTVPRDHLVVATGVLQNPEEVYTETQRTRLNEARKSEQTVVIRGKEEVGKPDSRPPGEGPLTWRFHAERVRTFAWASSEAFILDAASLGDTLLQSAYPEDYQSAWSKSTQMLRKAIEGYSKRWFPYPYPMATNVAGAEGGMEYPMIIFCQGRSERSLFGVTTHEIGHTWFPMVVNTDERRHAWMDEGFNTFINTFSEAEYFGRDPGRTRGPNRLAGVPLMTPADQLNMGQLGLQYYKTSAGLQLLREEILGPERFDAAFRTYIRRWAFKSPQPADFFRTMEDAAGADLAWFWRGWFQEDATLDQAVDGVKQGTDRPAVITFTNLGRMVMPLRFQVTFADGTKEVQQVPVQAWFRTDRIIHTLDSDKEVKEVRVDPQRVLPDADRKNNVWTAGG
jgi:hypothetical protein